MSPWLKYLLFQIPGWIGAAIIAMMAVHWQWLTWPIAAAGIAVWVVKDLLMFPFLRRAYEPDVTGAARLAGERGVAEGDLTPRGYVRVRGELWRAAAVSHDEPIAWNSPSAPQRSRASGRDHNFSPACPSAAAFP